MSLESKVVVVLGGSTGMGFATAKAAAAEGAQVVITGRSQEKLQAALAQLPAGSRTAALDVVDEAGTRSLFDQIGHVDHIFVTAASVLFGVTLASDSAELRPAMDTRFLGSLYAAKYGAPQMKNGGSITLMSGTSAWKPGPAEPSDQRHAARSRRSGDRWLLTSHRFASTRLRPGLSTLRLSTDC